MKRRIKIIVAALLTVIIILLSCINICAAEKSYSWYCKHRKDNLQPEAGAELSFIEKYDAYYIDKRHGDDSQDKVIYLTFDAGYENGNVAKILDTLKKEDVPAAFFILGNLVVKNTDLVERMFAEGHLVCNHTYRHKSMIGFDQAKFNEELDSLNNICLEFTGKQVSKFYRPPEGKFDESSLKYAKLAGYKTVFWSFGYEDWDNNKQMSPDKAKRKILENLHNGEIMLLHPTSATNAAILGEVIREIKAQGYRFGTLDELT